MSKKALILAGIGIIIIAGLGLGGYLFSRPKCPASCDDGNSCTQDVCSKETDYKCQAKYIQNCCGNTTCETAENYETCPADCPNCDDNNACTKDSYDYHEGKCVNAPILDVVCCGNTACEVGETYTNCARDCPNCDDDNKCTKDRYDYNKQKCVSDIIIPCCGNAICDKSAETYSNCSTDCPNCDDNNRLTADSFNYTAQKCENVVTHYFIDDFEQGVFNWEFWAEKIPATTAWSTAVEGRNTVLRGIEQNWATLISRKWDDYIFKAKFKIIKGSIHFNYRLIQVGELPNRYFVRIDSNGVVLHKQIQENFYDDIAGPPISLPLDGGWHTFEIRGYGNVLNILVDNNLLIKYKDTQNPVLSGGVGLETHDYSEFWIDNIEIKVIAEKDVTYP